MDQGQAQEQLQGQQQQQQLTPEQQQQLAAAQQQMEDLRSEPFKKQALELAQFLRHNPVLKNKQGVLDGKRVDYFKGKNALKALQSEAYQALCTKNPTLPKITNLQEAGEAMRLLPIHLLALRVDLLEKEKAKKGASQAKPARKVQINRQQEISEEHSYVWFYEYIPLTTKLAGLGLLLVVLLIIMYPLWPTRMRFGVYYLSWLALGLVGMLMALAVVRLILYLVTIFAAPPGLWLFPNLFEDVGFFDSFKPLYAWHEDKAAVKQAKREAREAKLQKRQQKTKGEATKDSANDTPAETPSGSSTVVPRAAYAEEVSE